MPTREHEFWLELIDDQPSFTAVLLRWAGIDQIPPFAQVRVDSGDLAEYNPTEYRADKVVSFYADPMDKRPVLAVILEMQRRYVDEKHWSWPAYVANLRGRRRCPVLLVVICPNETEAEKCREPIPLGNPGSVLCPLVIGQRDVPVILNSDQATDPLDVVVSAFVHGAGPAGEKVFTTLLDMMEQVEAVRGQTYLDNVLAVQPEPARRLLEILMTARTREYKSDFFRRAYGEGKAEGKAEGEAKAILEVLAARDLTLSEEARVRITSCTDLDQLENWIRRVATVESVEDLFD
ncbi:hypothetical protein [Actinomadura alba]|uniref:DUF4351 domain-containing protein n=1 Tax=Actinomadura alba TaxID=406431 RepID=A0ABR7M1M9_9ACTN|nr:hypothetical protein [Actinomadura alba]MBC6471017.1 hypothetical protein [Actinomadura alba]